MSLEWNVFLDDFNNKKIVSYNIFRHSSFEDYCRKALKEFGDDRAAFEEQLRRELTYYFRWKCEYEVIISGWPPREDFNDKKVSAYDQVFLNWHAFTEYIWSHRSELMAKRKEEK